MCGIVGYIGKASAPDILVHGLSKLEYRGYDSAGIAVLEDGQINVEKKSGKLAVLQDALKKHPLHGNIGIGHTRWATHGRPTDSNAHPHCDPSHDFVLVHNGIIENYAELKETYLQSASFASETDTEVLVQLIAHFYQDSLKEAVRSALRCVKGSYAIAVLSTKAPDELVLARQDSPLVVGVGDGENFVASDVTALLAHTRQCIYLEDGELAVLTRDGISIESLEGTPVEPTLHTIDWDEEAAEKGGYSHFMIKEIHDQPEAFRRVLTGRLLDDGVDLGLPFSIEQLESFQHIVLIGCGTAYHSGLIGQSILERALKLPTTVELASEFRYRKPLIDARTLVIVISQSGETADTMAAMREAKKLGATTLAITNVVGSSLAREADAVVYLWAGPEISVASTKAYTTMLITHYLIALDLGCKLQRIDEAFKKALLKGLASLPEHAEALLQEESLAPIEVCAKDLSKAQHIFYLGRGMDWGVAQEGALKLKEISYIHAEAYAAGELKHGTLALIEKNTPVIAIALDANILHKTLSNVQEVVARGAEVIALVPEGLAFSREGIETVLEVPAAVDAVLPILGAIPLQVLAYHTALALGHSIDQPRNLAKSVTVE